MQRQPSALVCGRSMVQIFVVSLALLKDISVVLSSLTRQIQGRQPASSGLRQHPSEFIQSFIHSFIHPFIHSSSFSLYYKPTGCPKASSPQSAIQYFLFQYLLSSRFPNDIRQLFTSSSSSFLHFAFFLPNIFPRRFRWSRGSVLAFGTQVRGFTPGRSLRIFRAKKILSTPSFGGEVKPSVPCRSFTVCKRSLNVTWKSVFRQNYRTFLAHSSTFRCWVLSCGDTRGDTWWRKLERLAQITQ